jgi:tetratricopeptide (TPR) repeat protein
LENGTATRVDPQTVEVALAAAWSALNQGDLIRVLDLVRVPQASERAAAFGYLEALARARLGDLDEALDLYARHQLGALDDLDAQALGARLVKDKALSAASPSAAELEAAADAYEAVLKRFPSPFPSINAATLALLAGNGDRARRLSGATLDLIGPADPGNYFDAASKAEALLIAGDVEAATATLAKACVMPDASLGARSSTRRSMDMVASALGLASAERARLMQPLILRPVAMYCGHMFDADLPSEAVVAGAVSEALERLGPAVGFGALARGADIVMAEGLLARGAELNVVLPFAAADFVAQSVGEAWLARYQACLSRAASVVYATDSAFVGDPNQFRHGSDVAMGLARIRARQVGTDVFQIAVWDGASAGSVAGTAADVAQWQGTGGTTHIVSVPPSASDAGDRSAKPKPDDETGQHSPDRTVKAILFADFPGFSKLPEDILPAFWREIMFRISQVLDRHGEAVVFRNTWGDALYAVIDTAHHAVSVAFQLQEELEQVDRRILRIDSSAQMRIGLHLGPIYRGMDFVTGLINYYGTEVSRTARIEPITPPGAIYATEPFAAILALENPSGFASRYVGRLNLAKGYGTQRMYRVARTGGPA